MDASREWKEQIDAERIRAGVCRHCAGPVPCWSEFGDQVSGVRHSPQSFQLMRAHKPAHKPPEAIDSLTP